MNKNKQNEKCNLFLPVLSNDKFEPCRLGGLLPCRLGGRLLVRLLGKLPAANEYNKIRRLRLLLEVIMSIIISS